MTTIEDLMGEQPRQHACPGCGSAPLRNDTSGLPALVCDSCRGRQLPRPSTERLLAQELGMKPGEIEALFQSPGYRERVCADCAHTMVEVRVKGVSLDLCHNCMSCFIEYGILDLLTRGRMSEKSGVRAMPRAPEPSGEGAPVVDGSGPVRVSRPARGMTAAPSTPRWALPVAALVVVLTAVGVGVGAYKLTRPAPVVRPDLQTKYGAYLRDYSYGGRSAVWWSERLEALSPRGTTPNAPLLALTIERAQANGLVVDETAGTWMAKPSEALAKRILDRLEVK